MIGPKDTPYSGGLFYLRLKFTDDFPSEGPKVCFDTPIYHVNVSRRGGKIEEYCSLGQVYIDILNWWNPEYTLREVLKSIYDLFYKGNPDLPLGIDVSDEFTNHKDLFDKKVRYFVKKYASPNRTNKDIYSGKWDFTIDPK